MGMRYEQAVNKPLPVIMFIESFYVRKGFTAGRSYNWHAYINNYTVIAAPNLDTRAANFISATMNGKFHRLSIEYLLSVSFLEFINFKNIFFKQAIAHKIACAEFYYYARDFYLLKF